MLALGAREAALSAVGRRWHRERRSAWLRLAALAILVVNLSLAARDGTVAVHGHIVIGYAIATAVALVLAELRRGPSWIGYVFVAFDALVVILVFRKHLLASGDEVDHSLTAPSLAIGFVLLTHVALRLRPALVLMFSGFVIVGWMALLGLAIQAHEGRGVTHASQDWLAFWTEGALALAFAFAAVVCALLTHDHNVLLRSAVAAERLRANLSRFFSPTVLLELQTTGTSLALGRRQVAVMFVDLRGFTRLSESIPLEELATLLAEFRELVTREVFEHHGMIDKFLGDGVMAAFGQPRKTPVDARQALECAIHLGNALLEWKRARVHRGQPAPDAGIGLHFGTAIGGVLHSGSHDEFTLVGDAVNVAQRLERLSKPLNASVVASEDVLTAAERAKPVEWQWAENVELEGRTERMRIAYLVRQKGEEAGEQLVKEDTDENAIPDHDSRSLGPRIGCAT